MLTFNFSPFPELVTERLHLRRITKDDAEVMFEMRSNPEVMKYVNRPLAKTMDNIYELIKTIDERIDSNQGINWAITLKGKAKLIATIGFHRTRFEDYRSEVGYMMHPHYHGQGIIGEALKAVIDFGFDVLKFHSIEGVTDPCNQRSMNVLLKAGFIREGTFKENTFFNGKFIDSAVFSLLTPRQD